ncbi:ribosome-associated translation inhibitor RaiA [Crocinitomicaceae bacterium]|jgi:putative sigma-54 modulation protein|nr:ribosome-associated translation inhibitor RaiA [Flavobacteriales bacterium]MDA8910198.1 ribosome-associated translation inhibitor RaiA [Crocinitomicaceae bacterium]MDC0302188.1 ribosome-associated translation inhibitor RaiA [bacterium]MBT5932787.1 ribosome-associated translation inhibitor RaiA [Flavobacteriales bacterium]MDC0272274.1 ribosome-associated translation inhibitor RaiA [Crocinitomicaceae bacterium]
MDTQMHAIHFKADQKLLSFIQERLNKLEQFNDQIVSAEVYLRLDKDREKENKIAEIKLHVPGKEMFAKKQCKSFEEATNVAVEALRRQIMKEKSK